MTDSTRHLSLVMPGALGPVDLLSPAQLPPLPHLQRLLARGRAGPFPADTPEALLFRLFHLPPDPLAVAPLTYRLDTGVATDGWCMRADPVLLVPGQTSLMLMAAGEELTLEREEAARLVADLNEHFAEQGLRFEAPTPAHWYVFSDMEAVTTTPMSRVRGRSVTGRLPQGPDGVRWNGILAELQMLLHEHPLNRARVERGAPQVNSVWFWGGGRDLSPDGGDWRRVWSDDALVCALAEAGGVSRADRPATAKEFLAAAEPGQHLILLDGLAGLLPDIPQQDWGSYMAAMESAWWRPLWQALGRGELDSLRLYPVNGELIAINRRDRWRWWRRAGDWSELLRAADYGQTD